jgi:transcriptional regulator with XRE-family HTH domain
MTDSSRLDGVGRALRLLRLRRGRRQFQIEAQAGITKAMLSAYETGKRQPSLRTLGSLLDALEADLADLHRALLAGRQQDALLAADEIDRPYAAPIDEGDEVREGVDVRAVLGIAGPLAPGEEQALAATLLGFHRLLRYLHLEWRRRAAA